MSENHRFPIFLSGLLYVIDTPAGRVQWSHLKPLLSSCGPVKLNTSTTEKLGAVVKKTWEVKYGTAAEAEAAMATLNGTLLPNLFPTHSLCLSSTPEQPPSNALGRVRSLFFKCPESHPLLVLSAQELFKIFRPAGPIKSLKCNVHVGYGHLVPIIELYREQDAPLAQGLLKTLLTNRKWPECKLQAYDNCNLYVANVPFSIKVKELKTVFWKYGNITKCAPELATSKASGMTELRIMITQQPLNYAFVEFSTIDEAKAAFAAHGMDLQGSRISIRYREHNPLLFVNEMQPLQSTSPLPSPKVSHSDKSNPSDSPNTTNTAVPPGRPVDNQPQPADTKENNAAKLAKLEQVARDRLQEARQHLKGLRQENTVAQEAAEDARAQEKTAEEQANAARAAAASAEEVFATAQAALEVAAETRRIAVLEEEAARRKREAADLAEREALDAMAAAQSGATFAINSRMTAERTFQTASYLYGAVTQSLKSMQDKVKKAEEAEQDAERVLLAILSNEPMSPQPTNHSTPPPKPKPSPKSDPAKQPSRSYKTTPSATSNAHAEPIFGPKFASTDGATNTPNPQSDNDMEEKRRAAELAESIRKMNEMRVAEEKDAIRRQQDSLNATVRQRGLEALAAAAAAREKQKEEEHERRTREEAVCHDREQRDKLRQDQENSVLRQKRWMDATNVQVIRCKQRDFGRWPVSKVWTSRDAFDRYILVSSEFDGSQFTLDYPLVVAAVPWPILASPYQLDPLQLVQWQAVEDFFEAVRTLVPVFQFGAVLEKSQKRFHPDRWRSRRLLATVMNDELRGSLEATGMIVSQAINHLVTNWKAKQM